MKYVNLELKWKQLTLQGRKLGRLLIAVCLFLTLSSCQNFSPKDPQVSSREENKPKLEALELTAETWQTIEGNGIRLSLPESYRGGNPNQDLREIEAALTELQESYGKRLRSIKQNVDNIMALIAFDTRSLTPEALTNVNIVQHPLQESIDLETYFSEAVQQLQKTHQIEEQDLIAQNESSRGRIVAKTTTEDAIAMKQLFYFQPQSETVWITTYTTPAKEFQQRVANFEDSIASLQFQHKESGNESAIANNIQLPCN